MCIIHDKVEEFVFKETARQLQEKEQPDFNTIIPNIHIMACNAIPVLYVIPILQKRLRLYTVREAIQSFEFALKKSIIAQACLKK